jgi:hypothetical protein
MTSGFDAGGQFIIAAERVLFVYLAIKMAMDGTFTVGMIFAFMAYKQQFLDASTRLIDQAISYRPLDVHLNRIADIALARTEEPEGGSSPSRRRVSGALELRTAGFRYGMGEAEVLRAVDHKVEAGEMVALVGPSGGGQDHAPQADGRVEIILPRQLPWHCAHWGTRPKLRRLSKESHGHHDGSGGRIHSPVFSGAKGRLGAAPGRPPQTARARGLIPS